MKLLLQACLRPVLAGLCLLSMLGCAGRDEAPGRERTVDLARWTKVGDARWHFGPGIAWASAQAETGYLVSRNRYANFRLSIEFWVEDGTNSGIFLRCADSREISPETCYEVNIWDNHPRQDFRTGSIVTLAKPLARVDTVGRWNLLYIEAKDEMLNVVVNGQQTAQLRDRRQSSGYVAVQYGGTGTIRFRNFKLMPF